MDKLYLSIDAPQLNHGNRANSRERYESVVREEAGATADRRYRRRYMLRRGCV